MEKACIEVLVKPRGGRDRVIGIVGDALKVAVSASPVDGKANEAVVRLLAKQLRVSRGCVTIVSGATARRKIVCFEGLTASDITRYKQSVTGA